MSLLPDVLKINLFGGIDTEGVEVKIPFDKRPKTRVQGVVDLCFMWCWVSSFFRFGSAGVGCSWSKMLGVECLVFCQTGSTYYGIGAGVMSCWFLDCGLLVGD